MSADPEFQQQLATFQHLTELAERELALGVADERLLERAYAEARGVAAQADQIYWRLRATALKESCALAGNDTPVVELQAQLDAHEQRLSSRKRGYRWFWGVVCFAAIIGAFVFPRLAIHAYARGGGLFYAFAVLGAACLALIVIAYAASRYHSQTE